MLISPKSKLPPDLSFARIHLKWWVRAFLFSMHFHNTSSAYFSRWGNFSFLKGGQKGCHFYIHYERCIRGVL